MTEKKIGNLYGYTGGNYSYQVYDQRGLAPTLLNMGGGGGKMPHIVTTLPMDMRGISSTITTRCSAVCATNLESSAHYPMPGVLVAYED